MYRKSGQFWSVLELLSSCLIGYQVTDGDQHGGQADKDRNLIKWKFYVIISVFSFQNKKE